MRNDTFYFMRKHPVDLLRYLPAFLAKDETFKRLQDTLSWEHESYRLKLVDIAKQFFIDTASWSMADWEEFLMITPNPNANLEARRAAVKAKLLGGVLLNRRRLQELIENFAPYGEVAVEAVGDCVMRITILNGTFYWDELVNSLFQYLPAHIDLVFDIDIEPNIQDLHFALITNDASTLIHELIFNEITNQNVVVKQIINDVSVNIFDIDAPNINIKTTLNVGVICQFAVETVYSADYDFDETAELFEQYIKMRWNEFKHNPVIRHYSADGNDFDNEFDWSDIDDIDPFPTSGDFLKLYWSFPNTRRVRSITLLNPRDNISAAEINAVGNFTVGNQILINSRGCPTSELKSAFLVTREIEWILPPPPKKRRR